MATDSDRTNAVLKPMMDQQRAAAQKSNPAFQPPPEDAPVKAQRALNDARGRANNPLRRNG